MNYLLLPLILFCSTVTVAEDTTAVGQPELQADDESFKESAPNLRDELGTHDSDVTVDVRSYLRKDGATITEYAVRGRVYKIKVQPSGDFPPYYLYDRDGDGTFEKRLPGGAKRLSPPQWVVKEF